MEAGQVISLSPSFNSYSNSNLAEIAARVVEEFDSEEIYDEFCFERAEKSAIQIGEEDEDEEFEFAFVTSDHSDRPTPISADEIFANGTIRPVYPVFNTDLLHFRHMKTVQNRLHDGNGVQSSDYPKAVRLPLRELFMEERETTITTTSSDLDGLPAETYCVWRPKTAGEECQKKSSGGGSISKKWKFRHLLNRSIINSDGGKDSFVFLRHGSTDRTKENEMKRRRAVVK